jgi:hypothetical protein
MFLPAASSDPELLELVALEIVTPARFATGTWSRATDDPPPFAMLVPVTPP